MSYVSSSCGDDSGSLPTNCTPVKNIVMAGFGHITILDLDTIDLSNLNRQFLFRKKDVKQSKALVSFLKKSVTWLKFFALKVAARTVSQFNPAIKVTPIHADIKDTQYDVDWFSSFDIVLNALDNLGELLAKQLCLNLTPGVGHRCTATCQ